MSELVNVEIGKFVRNINKKEKKRVIQKVVHQTFWLIGCRLIFTYINIK